MTRKQSGTTPYWWKDEEERRKKMGKEGSIGKDLYQITIYDENMGVLEHDPMISGEDVLKKVEVYERRMDLENLHIFVAKVVQIDGIQINS